jgi:hypothetical protein
MNILAIFYKDFNLLSSIEDKSVIVEPATEFKSQYSTNENVFNVQNLTCTKEVFEKLQPTAGTMQAPFLLASVDAEKDANRLNVIIENGSLKIV